MTFRQKIESTVCAPTDRALDAKTGAYRFNRADLDDNVPTGASVSLELSGHFRLNGTQKQLTSTVSVSVRVVK